MVSTASEKADKKLVHKQKKIERRQKAKSTKTEPIQLGENTKKIEEAKAKRQQQQQKTKDAIVAQANSNKPAPVEDNTTGDGDAPPPGMIGDVSFRRTQTDKRMSNVQKVLLIGSRSINAKDRHLLQDIGGIVAHGRPHPKLDVRQDVGSNLRELCQLHNCNSSVFLEARKFSTSYLWLAQAPNGPSMKFQLLNVHTADELRMIGNSLKFSRPLLHFDAEFDQVAHLRIARALLTTTFNIPRYHSRSKPFVDHILCFFILEGRIYFRHYQIQQQTSGQFGLTEIGPRFVLDPQVLLQGCVQGKVVWKGDSAVAPSVLRKSRKERVLEKLRVKEKTIEMGERHRAALPERGPDPLENVFKRE